MKKLHFSITIALFLFLSATSVAQTKKMTTTLKGNLKNAQSGFFMLRQQGRADTVKLGAEGAFELMIEQHTGNYFSIEHGKQSITLFLLPSDNVAFQLNATNLLDAKELTGNSAGYCQYLIEKQRADRALQLKFQPFQVASIPGDKYYALRDSIRNARNEQLKTKSSAGKFIDTFVSTESKSFDYQMGFEILSYKTNASKSGIGVFPASMDAYTKGLDLNNEQLSYDFYFKSFALNYISAIAAAKYHQGTDKSTVHFYELEMETLCEKISSEKNKSILISEIMPQLMNDCGTTDIRKIVSTLEGCCKDPKLINSIKRVAAQYEYLYPGKPAPDAVFYDATGKTSRISDYRGKVIYIDTWATWCGPCKREIPSLKQLEEEFHGKNVQFISVSTDKDVNAWKNFIAKEQMGGLQLHQSEKFEETISKLYVVNSIPRFIIIDESGNIVNVDAPRPSSGEQIRQILNNLLAD
jgi:thiol-disulfide isomerase/thioredoxin